MATPRFDWYQSGSQVCISVLVKNRKQLNVEYSSKEIKIQISTSDGKDYNLCFRLEHEIDAESSQHKEFSSKVEIKVKKKDPIQWSKVGTLVNTEDSNTEDDSAATAVPQPASNHKVEDTKTDIRKYPSSSAHSTNWDKLVSDFDKEDEADKPEGDAALNKLFQQIYSGGNEDIRKAMNKSFVESGGTVLSTNWNEVGAKKVEMKPPDGMEWKKYDT